MSDLAYGGTVGTYTPTNLFAGDAPIVTEPATLDTGNLAQYTVVGRITASGKIVTHAPGASDGSEVACGILTQAANASSADVSVAIYTAGFFNHEALVWHASIDTLVERKAAFARTPIHIGEVGL